MGESEGETGRPQDSHIDEQEVRQLRGHLGRELTFQQAKNVMDEHAEHIAGDPESPVDRLIDELSVELKKDHPDQAKLDSLRQQLNQEHPLVAADTVTSETAGRHINDVVESAIRREREISEANIRKLVTQIQGLNQDIRTMANDAIGEAAEEFPQPMDDIIGAAESQVGQLANQAEQLIQTETPDALNFIQSSSLDNVPSPALKELEAISEQVRNMLIDLHSRMLKATSDWRKTHLS